MIYTTLNAIRAHQPCKDGWQKLLAHLGKTKAEDEPLAMVTVLESNGLDDALWCLRVIAPEHHRLIVSLACDFAEQSLRYVPEGEVRPANCIRTTRLWIEDKATLDEVEVAAAAASKAARTITQGVKASKAAGAAGIAAMAAVHHTMASTASRVAAQAADGEWRAIRFRQVMEETQ